MPDVVVRWAEGEHRRARLKAELKGILAELPRHGATKAILFGSLASGKIGKTSDLGRT